MGPEDFLWIGPEFESFGSCPEFGPDRTDPLVCSHVFRANLPGVKKEEVKVEWHRVERSSVKFLCRFRLPENTKTDEVKVSMENDVLTMTVPKEEVKKAEIKAIEIFG
ncbi:unnamed protein product, partial [Vitis vinifera]